MKEYKDLVEKLKKMTYTQFVGFINQWNVPPGSLSTVNEWSVFGHVNSKSKVLEVACTTGFSGRELARMTGCSVVGIDICKSSIESAQYCKDAYGRNLKLSYVNADACIYKFKKKFTHVIIGASLGFFENPQAMLEKLNTYFDQSGGYILASPYYGDNNIPQDLINECKKIIGITPTMCSYDKVRNLFQNFEVAYESRKTIVLETEEQMAKYTKDTVTNCCRAKGINSPEVYDVMYKRLYDIKRVSNELHKYQRYSVMVLRYLPSVYPRRLIELF